MGGDDCVCSVCLEEYIDASMLPNCGHSFCSLCIEGLAVERRSGTGLCPLCRVEFQAGTSVPNWSLRDMLRRGAKDGMKSAADPNVPVARVVAPPHAALSPYPVLAEPSAPTIEEIESIEPLKSLGIPTGLARMAREEAKRVGLRVFLLDNSGSTGANDGKVFLGDSMIEGCTRWEEIADAALRACELNIALGVRAEFHLLNPVSATGQSIVENKDFVVTQHVGDHDKLRRFLSSVQLTGVTPLAERVRALQSRFLAFRRNQSAASQKNACFFTIFTDGAPTPVDDGRPSKKAAQAAIQELKNLTRSANVRLVVRLCTDEDQVTAFWDEADSEPELPLDVLDDIESEAKQIAKAGNRWLAYTPAIHRLRESGTFNGLLDLLDEKRLSPGESAVLAGLLLDAGIHNPLPSWRHDASEFEAEVRKRSAKTAQVYDVRARRKCPPVDADELFRTIKKPLRHTESTILRSGLGFLLLFFFLTWLGPALWSALPLSSRPQPRITHARNRP